MKFKKTLPFLFISLFLVFPFFIHAQTTSTEEFSVIKSEIKTIKDDLKKIEDVSYTKILEKNLAILESANNALTQRWTPINAILAALTVVFTLITIAWASVFAFWYKAYRFAQKQRKEMAAGLESIRIEGEKIRASFEEKEKKILEQSKQGKKSISQLEEELEKLRKSTNAAITELNNKAFITVSKQEDLSFMPTISQAVQPFKINDEIKVCSKCGSLFQEEPGYGYRSAYVPILINQNLCPRCREEKSDILTSDI